jgi:hypothetical protein
MFFIALRYLRKSPFCYHERYSVHVTHRLLLGNDIMLPCYRFMYRNLQLFALYLI